jgi:molecular chaperone DnaK
VEEMLAEAQKYATADKEKRENIDVKNQAEALCFEAEKELGLLKDNISEDQQQNITKLIENIRQEISSDDFDALKTQVENLKVAMKDMVAANADSDSNPDPMSNLNDL